MESRSFEEFFGYVNSEIGKVTTKDAKAFYNKVVKASAPEAPAAEETAPETPAAEETKPTE